MNSGTKITVVLLFFLPLFAAGQDQAESTSSQAMPQMSQMQARMQAMQEQMRQIHATENPEERRRLMQEHMQSMRDGMMMMGQMMQGAMPDGQAQQCQQGDTGCRMNQMEMQQRMMDRRMGMMQQMMSQMMEQMMQQQASEAGAAEDHDEHH